MSGGGDYRTRPASDDHDTSWMAEARRTGLRPSLFFPERGAPKKGLNEAKAVCAGCPVAGRCLEYALTNRIQHGTWGGASERERRKIRRARAKAAANG